MTRTEKTLCVVYALIALVALVGTQWVIADYLAGSGTMQDFLDATVEGHAATFLSIACSPSRSRRRSSSWSRAAASASASCGSTC